MNTVIISKDESLMPMEYQVCNEQNNDKSCKNVYKLVEMDFYPF